MRPRWMVLCFTLAWIALAILATMVVLLWLRQARFERELDDSREHPKVIFDWGNPEEEDDARRHLDKSDER